MSEPLPAKITPAEVKFHSVGPKDETLEKWMRKVTALLCCYQSDIPMQHKQDLVKALDEYLKWP